MTLPRTKHVGITTEIQQPQTHLPLRNRAPSACLLPSAILCSPQPHSPFSAALAAAGASAAQQPIRARVAGKLLPHRLTWWRAAAITASCEGCGRWYIRRLEVVGSNPKLPSLVSTVFFQACLVKGGKKEGRTKASTTMGAVAAEGEAADRTGRCEEGRSQEGEGCS